MTARLCARRPRIFAQMIDMARRRASPSLRIWTGRVFIAAMVGWLLWRLYEIGWAAIWAARPRSPSFYLLLVIGYLVLPSADGLIYRRLFRLPFAVLFPMLLRKRIWNAVVLGYSGEVFLMMWARRRVAAPVTEIGHAIKDVNILSAAASTIICAALFGWLLAAHGLGSQAGRTAGILLLAVPALPLLLALRWRLVMLAPGLSAWVLGVHLIRFVTTQLIQLAVWHAALPDIDMGTLGRLLAVQMIVGRLPFLPNRDLLFIGAGLALSGPLALPRAALASLLVTASAIQQLLHAAFFLATMPASADIREPFPSCAS